MLPQGTPGATAQLLHLKLGLGPGPVCTVSSTVLAVLLCWLRGMPGFQYFAYLRMSYNNASFNSEKPSIFTAQEQRGHAEQRLERGEIKKPITFTRYRGIFRFFFVSGGEPE